MASAAPAPEQPGPNSAQRCLVVGSGTMPRACAERLRERGHVVVGLASDDGELRDWAEAAGIPSATLDKGDRLDARFPDVDYLFSVANLTVLPPSALRVARKEAINFHDGPLPAYAGLNATSWAILRGETEHAVTWHRMREHVDAGEVLVTEPVSMAPDETALTLNTKCYEAGLRAFEALLAVIENGRLQPLPDRQGPRRMFGRSDRPASGGWIDVSQDAHSLEALVRALEFGPYANPLARPALHARGGTFLVREAEVAPAVGEAKPGTVIAIGDEIRLRTARDDLLLRGFQGLDGKHRDAAEAAEELGLAPGERVPFPPASAGQHFERAAKRWLRHEDEWVRRLRSSEPLEADYLSPGRRASRGGSSREVSLQQLGGPAAGLPHAGREGDALLAAVTLLFARLGRSERSDVPYRHVDLASIPGVAAPKFASHVPLRVDVPAQGCLFDTFRDGFFAELDEVGRLGGFLRDLPLREPSLDGIDPAWACGGWPVTFERVAVLEHEEQPAADASSALAIVIPDDGRACLWRFDSGRVHAATVARLQERFQALCAQLSTSGDAGAVTVCGPNDLREMGAWNDTFVEPNLGTAVHETIEEQVRTTPHATAIIAGGARLSYEELNARANRLARLLHGEGVLPGTRAGIMTGRSADMVVSMLAVLKAGAAYVPLDPKFPADRLAFMVSDADVALVVADGAHAAIARAITEDVVVIDEVASELEQAPPDDLTTASSPEDLAYIMYTSGSTGRPKGVMLDHGNVLNFFAGMDDWLEPRGDDPGTWLAVTSISFDISVLELLWTLARGFEVVVYGGEDRRPAPASSPSVRGPSARSRGESGSTAGGGAPVEFSLFYFSADEGENPNDKYRLLMEGARFADAHGFSAVWTPERHFHDFGGLYPNPAVTGAAVAAVTERIRVRAGSCVLPLHHPVRVAEEWAVVDNLSAGRVDVSFASGWQPNDFVFAPDAYANRKEAMFGSVEAVRSLWRGETRTFEGPNGQPVEIRTLPRPVQPELPVWITAAGNPETFREAGKAGAGVLTHLLGQDLGELDEKIRLYRAAWEEAGWPGRGHMSLMMHAFVGGDAKRVREPLRAYLRSSAGLMMQFASSFPAFRGIDAQDREELNQRFRALGEHEVEELLDHAFERYYATRGLFGDVDTCVERVREVREADVDEIACLVDFGLPTEEVLNSLPDLARVREAAALPPQPQSIPELLEHHDVTHMQCTPSMARMLAAAPGGLRAMSDLKQLLVGGEALPRKLAGTLVEHVGGRVLNMYGPTEAAIWSSVQPVDAGVQDRLDGAVPIGTPIANTRVYVCDDRLRLLPPGVPGELVIGGAGVARGYWRRREATEQRFVPDRLSGEFGPSGAGRLYRTGDLGRWSPEGALEYLGRLDFQVKVRGHRIELEEIEAVLDQHPKVRQSVATAHRGVGEDPRLVAYVLPDDAAAVHGAELRRHLAARVPEVMVPDAIMMLDAFPLTPNRKIDRQRLPEPVFGGDQPEAAAGEPRTDLEALFVDIWRRVLSVERVGIHDDFFSLGGNSLLAVFLTGEIAKHGYTVGLGQLLRAPTVASIAQEVGQDDVRGEASLSGAGSA